MGRYVSLGGFLLLFGAVIYLGAIVREQQRAIEALVADQAITLRLQHKFSTDLQKLRQQVEQGNGSVSELLPSSVQ